jgi:hypothetical protein
MEILAEAVLPTLTEPKLRLFGEMLSAAVLPAMEADPPHADRTSDSAEQVKSSRIGNNRPIPMARDRPPLGKLLPTKHFWPKIGREPNGGQVKSCISYASTNIQGN